MTGGLALACCADAALVVFSQRDFVADAIDSGVLIGGGLALLASAMMAITGFIFRWSIECADARRRDRCAAADRMTVDIFCLCAALILVNCASGIISVIIGVRIGESFATRDLGIVAAAGMILGWAALSWRVANLFASGVAINALMYLEPAIAMGRILALGITAVARVDLLLMGAELIVGANVAIALCGRR